VLLALITLLWAVFFPGYIIYASVKTRKYLKQAEKEGRLTVQLTRVRMTQRLLIAQAVIQVASIILSLAFVASGIPEATFTLFVFIYLLCAVIDFLSCFIVHGRQTFKSLFEPDTGS